MKIKKIILLMMVTISMTACHSKQEVNTLENIKKENVLNVAVSPDYVPYEFINPNANNEDQYVGADIELAKYIASQLGVQLKIQAMDFSAIPSAIARSRFDLGISGFTYSKERAEQVDFSKPYDNSESTCQGLLIRKGNQDQFKTLEDFKNKRIAVQNGSLQQKYLDEELGSNVDVRLVSKIDEAILDLRYEKVDAIAISCASANSISHNQNELILSDVKFNSSDEDGMMIITSKGQNDLINEINKIIDEVTEQGLYEKWLKESQELAKELGVE